MNCWLTSIEKPAMVSASRPRLQAVCALLLCLFCGVAGAQTGPLMRVSLSDGGYLPNSDPYCTNPPSRFLGTNPQLTHLCNSVELSSIPAAIDAGTRRIGVVDWILVELRQTSGSVESAGGDTVIARKPGLLLSSGRVVDAMGYEELDSAGRNSCLTESGASPLEADSVCPDLLFEGIAISDNLYVVVRHRNHVDIISSVPVTATTSGRYLYDFSSSVDTVRDSVQKTSRGIRARVLDVAVMAAGDVDQNNVIRSGQDIPAIRETFGRPAGYYAVDVNLDGLSRQADDFADLLRSNVGLFSPVPN